MRRARCLRSAISAMSLAWARSPTWSKSEMPSGGNCGCGCGGGTASKFQPSTLLSPVRSPTRVHTRYRRRSRIWRATRLPSFRADVYRRVVEAKSPDGAADGTSRLAIPHIDGISDHFNARSIEQIRDVVAYPNRPAMNKLVAHVPRPARKAIVVSARAEFRTDRIGIERTRCRGEFEAASSDEDFRPERIVGVEAQFPDRIVMGRVASSPRVIVTSPGSCFCSWSARGCHIMRSERSGEPI